MLGIFATEREQQEKWHILVYLDVGGIINVRRMSSIAFPVACLFPLLPLVLPANT